jgi:hypothetical protein
VGQHAVLAFRNRASNSTWRVAGEPSTPFIRDRTMVRTLPISGRSITVSAMESRTAAARRWATAARMSCLPPKYW